MTTGDHGMTTGSRNSGGRFSADGSSLLFATTVADLVPGIADINTSAQTCSFMMWPRDRTTLSRFPTMAGAARTDGVSDIFARISASGRFVLFSASATNLIAGTTNHVQRLFLRDRKAGTTVNALRADYPTPPSMELVLPLALRSATSSSWAHRRFRSSRAGHQPGADLSPILSTRQSLAPFTWAPRSLGTASRVKNTSWNAPLIF